MAPTTRTTAAMSKYGRPTARCISATSDKRLPAFSATDLDSSSLLPGLGPCGACEETCPAMYYSSLSCSSCSSSGVARNKKYKITTKLLRKTTPPRSTRNNPPTCTCSPLALAGCSKTSSKAILTVVLVRPPRRIKVGVLPSGSLPLYCSFHGARALAYHAVSGSAILLALPQP